jgi:peroxiredoxin
MNTSAPLPSLDDPASPLAETLSQLPNELRRARLTASLQSLREPQAPMTLPVGGRAPEFALHNWDGKAVTLHDYLVHGPLVVSFFRGNWCSFCELEIRMLHRRAPLIAALGASVVAISPQASHWSQQLATRHELSFHVLTDRGNRVAEAWGLLADDPGPTPDPEQLARYNDGELRLPTPATFLLDSRGQVLLAHVNPDPSRRLNPDRIVDMLRELRTRG